MYLPESKIDHAKISAVFIKEIVGSVYDDHPLCELVFEGKDFDSLVLKQSSCAKDYLASGSYLSVDAYQGRRLNDHAQRWVKLRPGMSESEVKGLLGMPSRVVYDSSVGSLTFEYGYGRARFYGSKGLSGWTLD